MNTFTSIFYSVALCLAMCSLACGMCDSCSVFCEVTLVIVLNDVAGDQTDRGQYKPRTGRAKVLNVCSAVYYIKPARTIA